MNPGKSKLASNSAVVGFCFVCLLCLFKEGVVSERQNLQLAHASQLTVLLW